MPFSLLPKAMTKSVADLQPEMLNNWNIRLLMLDFDNTLVPYTTDIPADRIQNWLQIMKDSNIKICVVSNSKKDRVKVFCEKYGIACVTHAKKPFSKGIRECLSRFGVSARETALVGDQIFTDVLGANAAGLTSILVCAIDNHNFWLKARHVLEKPFIYAARKRRI